MTAGTFWYLWNFRRSVIEALTARGWEVVALAPHDEDAALLAALPNVRVIDWPLQPDGLRPWREAASLLRLMRILRSERPQALLTHTIKANVYGGLAARAFGLPYAVNVTGLGMAMGGAGRGSRALARLYAYAASGAGRVFVQNLDDLAFLRARGLPDTVSAVRTMGSGVDLPRFIATAPSAQTPRTLLFAGRLQEDKGIHDFVAAARALRAAGIAARCIAIGSRRHANRGAVSEDTLRAWQAEGVVEFPGHQDDVRPWLADAHAVVLPSHGGEGVPRVTLEAAAAGRAAIVSDVPGCRDAVIDGRTGLIHPPRDQAALQAAMARIATMPIEDLAAIGAAARARAEDAFSDAPLIAETLAWLESAVAGKA